MSNEKSSVIINIKDIIGKFKKPLNTNYISYFKTIISIMPAVRELKNQKSINISMFYIDNFEGINNVYLAYIYHNNNDLYFIYDSNATNSTTKLYDIGSLSTNQINKLTQINRNLKNINTNTSSSSSSSTI